MNAKKENIDMIILSAIANIMQEKGKDEPISSSEIHRYVTAVLMKNVSRTVIWDNIRKLEDMGYITRYSIIPKYRSQGIPKNIYKVSEEGYEKLQEWQKSGVQII